MICVASMLHAALASISVVINGQPAIVGNYSFPSDASEIVIDNGLALLTFGPSTGTITLLSAIIDGLELASNLTGSPPDKFHNMSFYVDSDGGAQDLICDTVSVIRLEDDLVELAFVDTTNVLLRHSHHVVVTSALAGVYGWDVMTAVVDTTIGEVRMNTRWNRCILDHAYNWERGHDTQQPTYAYLWGQDKVQDETWMVDGSNNATLPCPDDNEGGLPAGYVYSKYDWSLYHHENPFWGHYGQAVSNETGEYVGVGVWFSPLGGISDTTSAGNYGVGPLHQDLALHQDAIILNYMGANHYGLPGYALKAGYRRFYGPWLTFFTTGDGSMPEQLIAQASGIAMGAINDSIPALPFVQHPLYPTAAQRSTVHGVINITDGRSASDLWVLMTTEVAAGADVYTIHEPVYFVRTSGSGGGAFSIPGVPLTGDTTGETITSYSLYVFSAGGTVTDTLRIDNITLTAADTDLGTITWSPVKHGVTVWQIGVADGMGGEYNGGQSPRNWVVNGGVPGTLDFTIGTSHEPFDWYFAQTQGGAWTVHFDLIEAFPPGSTAYLTVAASLTQSDSPSVSVNGNSNGITGSMPRGSDSTLSRQAIRSGYPRLTVLSFDASSMLRQGSNTIAFSRQPEPHGSNNTGMGWDTLVLEVDAPTSASSVRAVPAVASASSTMTTGEGSASAAEAAPERLGGLTATLTPSPVSSSASDEGSTGTMGHFNLTITNNNMGRHLYGVRVKALFVQPAPSSRRADTESAADVVQQQQTRVCPWRAGSADRYLPISALVDGRDVLRCPVSLPPLAAAATGTSAAAASAAAAASTLTVPVTVDLGDALGGGWRQQQQPPPLPSSAAATTQIGACQPMELVATIEADGGVVSTQVSIPIGCVPISTGGDTSGIGSSTAAASTTNRGLDQLLLRRCESVVRHPFLLHA